MESLEQIVAKAKSGDHDALEKMIVAIQSLVYNLSIKMLWHPEDAEDASQEILIRIITHLSKFRNESSFTTWVYRVACNYLLTTKKRRAEREEITFDQFAEQLKEGLRVEPSRQESEAEKRLLIEEIKIGCTQGMLLCLDRSSRLAYILGEILDLSAQEASAILKISSETFRKRLSRARVRISKFMSENCGIVKASNACQCSKRIPYAIQKGRVNPDQLLFVKPADAVLKKNTIGQIRKLEEWQRVVALYRSNPKYSAPEKLQKKIKSLIRLAK